ncbi:PhzF family phenazine biosynthesis protein [Halorussus amylolyticus]|uniref:PhzF family phenazine biosynthesis protein n=1 Tax=Halorussus amylolyticus TaxID=1126242 RepID=UPI00104CAC91|nr:PhzF family phenazine biosynthesis protein [Halorussus amylolyticus]
MRTRRALQVDAFTDEPFAGNAAGVVPDADGLTDAQMQAIANELAVSETAFFRESDDADRRIRYFTPTTEVDLCGHATIASHAHLLEDGVVEPGTHTLETNVGVLDIEIREDGAVWMTQDDHEIRRVDLDYERIAGALGIDHAALQDVGADLPLAVASTGLPFLVVPVNFLEHVSAMDPDFSAIETISEEVEAAGIYAFTFDALGADSTLHGRMFAPAAGVPEDPVTGTASGACGAYLREYRAFDGEFPDEMRFEQGHFVDRPGYVQVRVGDEVQVGGRAATALDGELRVPERDDEDEIIEV